MAEAAAESESTGKEVKRSAFQVLPTLALARAQPRPLPQDDLLPWQRTIRANSPRYMITELELFNTNKKHFHTAFWPVFTRTAKLTQAVNSLLEKCLYMTEALQEHPKCGLASWPEKVQDAEGVGKRCSHSPFSSFSLSFFCGKICL